MFAEMSDLWPIHRHVEELALWHWAEFGSSSIVELSGCCLWLRRVTERSGVTPAASRLRVGVACWLPLWVHLGEHLWGSFLTYFLNKICFAMILCLIFIVSFTVGHRDLVYSVLDDKQFKRLWIWLKHKINLSFYFVFLTALLLAD